ncbi:MAG TPA: hypothetical protein VK466_09655, partial [Terriglobales bacterium]|nr:hypothetical protein [Terriglobales bacterium]
LQREQLQEVLDIELAEVQRRVLETAKGQFLFRVTDAGRDFLLREGTDQRYGARHLKRAIERYVVYPLANLLATDQVRVGDLVRIDWDGQHSELTFVREGEAALVGPTDQPTEAKAKAAAAQVSGGKSVDAPSQAVADARKGQLGLPAAAPAAAPQAKKKVDR